MLFDKFKDIIKEFWGSYFEHVSNEQKAGRLEPANATILYPNILLLTNCNGYYIAELMGASKTYTGLKLKTHNEPSINRYFRQFDDHTRGDTSFIHFNSRGVVYDTVTIASDINLEGTIERFPALEMYETTMVCSKPTSNLFSFGEEFTSCALHNVVLINKNELATRAKFILGLFVFSSKLTKKALIKECEYFIDGEDVRGVRRFEGDIEERKYVASQLQNTFLFHGLRETTIGEFIRLHPDIIKRAFDTDHFIYEPSLDWKEHDGTCEDTAINPDLLVRRKDGTYDIYDLKTALLTKPSLTISDRKRRQFVDTVRDGVAQLGNYLEYFSYPKNAKHALEKYGVVVSEPNLVLIVGNYENFDAAKVSQAGRLLPNLQIIDYDTVTHLFMGLTQANTPPAISTL